MISVMILTTLLTRFKKQKAIKAAETAVIDTCAIFNLLDLPSR